MKSIKEIRKLRSTFSVMFYINRTKIKKNGMCQVLGRITVDAGIAQIGTKAEIDPALWDAKAGRATGRSKQALAVNRILNRLAVQAEEHYAELVESRGFVSAETVKNALKGVGRRPQTLLALFEEHNEEFAKRVGVNRVKATLEHYQRSLALLKMFLRDKCGADDITLRSMNLTFIESFDIYLRVERLMSQHTISGHLINLKKMARRAVSQGTLKRDPFLTFIPEQPAKKCRHLKSDEIDRLMRLHIDNKSIRHTRDMFIFSTFTGLAYTDLKKLSDKHLSTDENGNVWIRIERSKTGTESNIRLLDIPRQIMERYRDERTEEHIFRLPTLSCMCTHFRKLEKMCGIGHITFHMARHNFGTHITLSQGVPIETICRMMGHSSITTTQLYAKITDDKLNEDGRLLSERLSGKFAIFEDGMMPVGISYNQNFRLNDDTINPLRTKRKIISKNNKRHGTRNDDRNDNHRR